MDQADKPYSSLDGTPVAAWLELDVIDTFSIYSPADSFVPLDNTLNSFSGAGQYQAGTAGGNAIRGGDFDDEELSGIYSLRLALSEIFGYNWIGFRCVYRPAP